MIFITVGSQKFQFDRLLKAVDELIEQKLLTEEVFAQIGYCRYKPKHYAYQKFLDHDEFERMTQTADIILTHGGTGVIIGALKKGKKVIAVPRLAQYGEHVDDHQLQLISQFQNLNLICSCQDLTRLSEAFEKVRTIHYKPYESNTERIVSSIADYIDSMA